MTLTAARERFYPEPPAAADVITPEDLVELESEIPTAALEECARSCGHSLFRDEERGVTYAVVRRSLARRPAAIAQLRGWEKKQTYPKRQDRPGRPHAARNDAPTRPAAAIFPKEER